MSLPKVNRAPMKTCHSESSFNNFKAVSAFTYDIKPKQHDTCSPSDKVIHQNFKIELLEESKYIQQKSTKNTVPLIQQGSISHALAAVAVQQDS
jgi:hypothetical protein